MKAKATIVIFFVVLFSCRKDNNPNVILNGALTDCAANSTCTYSYYDNADFTNWNQPVHGNYRVFWYKSVNNNLCDATSELYFKISLSAESFDITANQIAAGQVVAYNLECPCCDYAFLPQPIGGEIKGKRSDANHWLINASVIFGTAVNKPIDTLVVNQYFSAQSF